MQAAETGELGVLQAGDHAEDLGLGPVLQLGLEPDHVEQCAQRIVLTQLDDGVGLDHGVARIGQADGLHRAVAQGLAAALGHDLDGQAAVEIGDVLPRLELRLRAVQQGVDESLVLGLVHGAVDIGGGVAAGAFLVVARLPPGGVEIDAVGVDDGGDGVEEAEGVLAGQLQDGFGQGRGGQGAGGDDDIVPILGRQAGDLLALDRDKRMGVQTVRHGLGETLAINRQRAAGRHLMGVATGHDDGVERTHFSVQQPHRVVFPVVRTEGVGTDQFGERVCVMGVGGHAGPAHLVDYDRHTGARNLPGGF